MNPLRALRNLWTLREAATDVVGINRRNVELVYGHNLRRDYPLVDDKLVCKDLLVANDVPVPPTVCTVHGLFAIDGALDQLRHRGDFVVKPANGSGGDGILVVGARDGDGWRISRGRTLDEDDLRDHLASTVFGAWSRQLEDRAIVEERVVQHALLRELYDGGVSDIRLLMLQGRCVMAMVRLPTEATGGRANLHQGGVGAAIDLATGTLFRALQKGREVSSHPDSGAPIVGRQLPWWQETLAIGRRAAASVPLGFLGIDVVLDAERGPLVLEMNARPGLEIQNVNGRPLGQVLELAS